MTLSLRLVGASFKVPHEFRVPEGSEAGPAALRYCAKRFKAAELQGSTLESRDPKDGSWDRFDPGQLPPAAPSMESMSNELLSLRREVAELRQANGELRGQNILLTEENGKLRLAAVAPRVG